MPTSTTAGAAVWLGCALLAATACGGPAGGSAGSPAGPATGRTAQPAGAQIATVRGDRIAIFKRRDASRPWKTLASPNEYGAPRVFLVERNAGDWLEVLLPIRPNGSTGWVRAAEVGLARTTLEVRIDPRAHRFTVRDGDRVVRAGKIAIGTWDTPTPAGRFYFTELIRPKDPTGPYGAYAYGLSGFSPKLRSFAGGPGQLAVHGTNDPGSLGTDVSHGCIRVGNDDITWMARNLALGTPVVVTS